MQNFVDRKDFYRYKRPDLESQTKKRLTQLSEMGMQEVGTAEFGIKGVTSGLYIERVWNFSDKEWNNYMEWVNSLINKNI